MEAPFQSFAAARARGYAWRRTEHEVDVAIGLAGRGAADSVAGLLERDSELAAIKRLLERAVGGAGSLLIVEGPAGVGKTRLLDVGAQTADATGVTVLRASGSELERELGFGVVRSLFERELMRSSVARRRSLLSGAAGLAAPAVAPRGAAGGRRPSRQRCCTASSGCAQT
jgi:hypothetical protein